MKASIFSLLLSIMVITACNSPAEAEDQVEVTGIIEETGITSYQYGSHTITKDDVFYALTSDEIDLSKYVGEEVTVIGEKIEGYSLEGGPEYLRVKEVKD